MWSVASILRVGPHIFPLETTWGCKDTAERVQGYLGTDKWPREGLKDVITDAFCHLNYSPGPWQPDVLCGRWTGRWCDAHARCAVLAGGWGTGTRSLLFPLSH